MDIEDTQYESELDESDDDNPEIDYSSLYNDDDVDEFDEDPCDQDCKNCFGSLCIVALALGQIVPFACIFRCLV